MRELLGIHHELTKLQTAKSLVTPGEIKSHRELLESH